MKNGKFTKILALLLVSIMVLSIAPFNGLGEVFKTRVSAEQDGPYTYSVDDGKATITGFDGSLTYVIEIPATLGEEGYPVVGIGEKAFEGFTAITSVIFPNTVTSIGDYSFRNCADLESITIPDSVKSIGIGAFMNSGALGNITISDSVTSIGVLAFSDTSYYNDDGNWDNNVLYIGKYLIKAKPEISGDYEIKDGTLIVANRAFDSCNSLVNINVPDSVTNIGTSAFGNCTGLKSVTGLNSVTSIGEWVFSCCSSLTSINIPDSVKTIGNYAFDYCSGLTSITGLNSVTNIGTSAFGHCSALTDINIPDSVTTIGEDAFVSCTALTSINIPDSVTNIGTSAFENCTGLESVTGLNSVTSIASGAFVYCNSLKSITIPKSVTDIGANSFRSCTGLTSITIPHTLTAVEDSAFRFCSALTTVYYCGTQEEWNAINRNNNNECLFDAENIYFGENLVEGSYTFSVADEKITITGFDNSVSGEIEIVTTIAGYPVTAIGDGAFDQCENLTAIVIPEGIITIGSEAFLNCTSLTNLTVPKSVVYFGNGAFGNSHSISKVVYGGSKTDWGEIYFGGNNGNLTTDNTLFTEILPEGKLYYGVKLNFAVIEDAEETISGNLTIPSLIDGHHVSGINIQAFSGCSALTGITIPAGVGTIGNEAFYNCSALESITIPGSVKRIGKDAFFGCDSLTDVYYDGDETNWNNTYGNKELLGKNIHYMVDYSDAKLPEITSKTAKYKNNVTVKITATGIPESGFLVVDRVKIAPDANGIAVFETQFQAKESKTFKAKVVNRNEEERVREQEFKVEVNTGFFAKIAAFFTDFLFNGFKWKNALIEF